MDGCTSSTVLEQKCTFLHGRSGKWLELSDKDSHALSGLRDDKMPIFFKRQQRHRQIFLTRRVTAFVSQVSFLLHAGKLHILPRLPSCTSVFYKARVMEAAK